MTKRARRNVHPPLRPKWREAIEGEKALAALSEVHPN